MQSWLLLLSVIGANSRCDEPIQTCELLKYANPARLGSARIDWLGQGEIRLACPCLRSLLPLLLLLLLPLLLPLL